MNATSQAPLQIDVDTLDRLRRDSTGIVVLDVREPWERDICAIESSVEIPLGQLPERVDSLQVDDTVVVVCHHGVRSLRATLWLREQGFPAAVNLEGGIDAWADRIDRTMVRY
jgi:rhodanese-related sulfurtransferase